MATTEEKGSFEGQVKRFKAAYDTLGDMGNLPKREKDKAIGELNALLAYIEKVSQCVTEAQAKGESVKEVLEKLSDESNKAYGLATSYSRWSRLLKYIPLGFTCSRYVELTRMNFNHFREQALVAYKAGHTTALETACTAHKVKDSHSDKYKYHQLLLKALTQDLTAEGISALQKLEFTKKGKIAKSRALSSNILKILEKGHVARDSEIDAYNKKRCTIF